MQIEQDVLTFPGYYLESQKKFGPLPNNIVSGSKFYFPPDTNIFINDADISSLEFLAKLRSPIGIIGASGEQRNVEIWEADYLSERLAEALIFACSDLTSRVIVPMTGCGEVAATGLARRLRNDYDINIPIVSANDQTSRPSIIVDDVLKTGGTMLRELPSDQLLRPDNIYAAWAMSALSQTDYLRGEKYKPLRLLTNRGQQIFAGVVYAGSGLASPGLGLPVNSISTLLNGDEKSTKVVSSLATKYFGNAIYRVVAQET